MTNFRKCRLRTVHILDLVGKLTPDVLEYIFGLLPQEFFTRWLLQLPKNNVLRQAADSIMEKQLYFILLSRKDNKDEPFWSAKDPWTKFGLDTFRGLDASNHFLRVTKEVRPRRVILAALEDFELLRKFLVDHRTWIASLDHVEVILRSFPLTEATFSTLETLSHNLVSLRLERVWTWGRLEYIRLHGLTRFPKLTKAYLDCATNSSEALDPEGWEFHYGHTLSEKDVVRQPAFPPRLTELHLLGCGLLIMCPPTFLSPPNLQRLEMDYSSYPTLDLKELPPMLTTLRLFCMRFGRLKGCTLPELLETINIIDDDWPFETDLLADFARISTHGWPSGLKRLRVPIDLFASLYNVPPAIETLTIRQQFHTDTRLNSIILSSYPNLVELNILKMLLPERVEFPPTLERLSMTDCEITSLKWFEFPTGLRKIDFSRTKLPDINTYPYWHRLVSLVELDLTCTYVRIGLWIPPPNLEILKLRLTKIDPLRFFLLDSVCQHLKLRILDLKQNYLTDILGMIVPQLLEILILDNNPIEHIPLLVNVKHLSLQVCLRDTSSDCFHFEPQKSRLQTIDVTSNWTRSFDRKFQASLARIGLKVLGPSEGLDRRCEVEPLYTWEIKRKYKAKR